jgi:hypothetical protein
MQVSTESTNPEARVLEKRAFAAGFFYTVIAILLCYGTFLQIARMEKIHFTTHDDMEWDLLAHKIENIGFMRGYLPAGEHFSVDMGRFNYYVTIFFCAFPYFFANPLIRALVIVAIHFSSMVAMACLLQHYVRLHFGILLISIQLAFLQHSWDHYPVGAGPIVHHLPILLFFVGALIYVRGRRKDSSVRVRLWCSVLAFTLLFLSLLFYEALSLPFLVIFAAVILAERQEAIRAAGSTLAAIVRVLAPISLVLLTYLAMYFTYKHFHPTHYGGTALQMKSWQNAKAGLSVLTNLTVAGLPGVQVATQDGMMKGLGLGALRQEGWRGFLTDNLGFGDVLAALLLIAALIGYRNLVSRQSGQSFFPRRPVFVVAFLAISCAIMASLPVALTQKWQQEQPEAHATSYFAYLSFSVVIALMACLLGVAAGRGMTWARCAFNMFLLAAFGVSILTSAANNAIVRSQVYYASKWRLMDAFLATTEFRKLPEQSTILAPEMWQGVYQDENYWSTYVKERTGRSIYVVKALQPQLPGNTLASLSFDVARPDGACCIVLIPVQNSAWLADPQGVLSGGTVYVIGDRGVRNATLSYGIESPHAATSQQLEIPTRPLMSYFEIPVSQFHGDHGVYVAEVQTAAPVVVGTTSLTIRPTLAIPRRHRIELFFNEGFYETEGEEAPGREYWRWSQGSRAEGQLTLYNYSSDLLAARFQGSVDVSTIKMTQFEVTSGAATETLWVNNEGYAMDRVLWLKPGPTRLTFKSYAPRVDAPTDPRYMVFRIRNWKVKLLDPAEMAAIRKQVDQPVDLEFSQGFWRTEGTEGLGSNYFRWCDSPSGAGVITIINRTTRPVKASFQAVVATGVAPKTELEIVAGGVRRNLLVGSAGENVDLDLVVKPGRNDILLKSHAPRVPAPNDPRYLTFRVINWKLKYHLTMAEPPKDPFPTLGAGFYGWEGDWRKGAHSWSQGAAELLLTNPAGEVLERHYSFILRSLSKRHVTIFTPTETRTVELSPGEFITAGPFTIHLKPGETPIRFETDRPAVPAGGSDPRNLTFSMAIGSAK